MNVSSSKADVEYFRTLLQEEGIFEAMRFLNSRSTHRFTALYAFDGPILENICLADKEENTVIKVDSIDVVYSYCLYVRDSGRMFTTPDSLADDRLKGHPKQAVIQSYCGMPLMNSSSYMIGTLCHFDFIPAPYSDDEVRFLELILPSLASWLEDTQSENAT